MTAVLTPAAGRGAPPPEEKPFRAQGTMRRVWAAVADELMVSGPAGTGKSRVILEYLYALCMKHAGIRGLIVRQTRHSLTESALVTFETHVVPGRPAWVANQQRRVRQAYQLPNGSEIVVGGLDNTAKFMSTEFDWIYVQEAREIEEASWEDLTSRLRNGKLPFQMIVGDTNPDGPSHWILRRAATGKLAMIETRHEDNPVLFDERRGEMTEAGRVYIGRLDNLTGVRHKRLRGGLWVGAEGMIYDTWDRTVHMIAASEVTIEPEWKRYIVVDFGFTNPFVAQWWAEDPDGRLYRYREVYGVQRLVQEWAHWMHDLSAGERISAIVCDTDAEDRATLEAHIKHSAKACVVAQTAGFRGYKPPRGESFANLTTDRRWTVGAVKDVQVGIEAVKARLMKAGDGRPRLSLVKDALVMRDSLCDEAKIPACTEEEIEGYVWDKVSGGRMGERLLEEPLKKHDHGCDAMRYLVMHLDKPRRTPGGQMNITLDTRGQQRAAGRGR